MTSIRHYVLIRDEYSDVPGVRPTGRPGLKVLLLLMRPMSHYIHQFGNDSFVARTIVKVLTGGSVENRNSEGLLGDSLSF